MVVLAASLCTPSGKVLVSRQFVEVPRTRIEGLLAAFPKLASSAKSSQHTTIETENIRYVYQPLDNLYLVMLTNRQSNILQDIETLRLLARVVNKICHSNDESTILDNGFELLTSFDEVVSLGYRDSVTLSQISTTIEMESHEERIQEIISKNKEKEAKEKMKEKIKLMDEQRKRDSLGIKDRPSASLSSGSSGFRTSKSDYSLTETSVPEPKLKVQSAGKGMKLGSKPKKDIFASLEPELDIDSSHNELAEVEEVDREGVHYKFEEKISAQISRDGAIHGLDIRGDLAVQVSSKEYSLIQAHLTVPDNTSLQFMTNPKIDKNAFNSDNILTLKDSTRGFPINQSVGILKWKASLKDASAVPVTINCWISPTEDGFCDVDIEVILDKSHLSLNNFVVNVPIQHEDVEVGDCTGNFTLHHDEGLLLWEVPELTEDFKEASIHFRTSSQDEGESLFPISVEFSSNQLYTDLQISEVVDLKSQEVYPHSQQALLFTEEYHIL